MHRCNQEAALQGNSIYIHTYIHTYTEVIKKLYSKRTLYTYIHTYIHTYTEVIKKLYSKGTRLPGIGPMPLDDII